MKFIFETMRFLLKHITLNQQITLTKIFHTYFTTFKTAAPRRITNKTLKIKQLDAKSDCLFSFTYFRLQHSFTSSVNRDVNQ